MREILFRGKRVDNGEWVEGYLFDDGFSDSKRMFVGGLVIEEYEGNCDDEWDVGYNFCEVIPETVGQFTGLTDENGKKIFEGDILNCITSDFDGSDKYVYNFKVTNITDYEQMGFLDFCHEIEVIGNIHDNPELLKEGANNG